MCLFVFRSKTWKIEESQRLEIKEVNFVFILKKKQKQKPSGGKETRFFF